jgi:glycosyltransferase involved in cell wall biosynthesis
VSAATIAAPESRNAPCPCGSGRRYKDCHGTLAPVVDHLADALTEAREHLQRGDVTTARAACEARLRESPDDRVALELMAACETSAGNPFEAVRLLLRAVRAPSQSATPATTFALWTALNSAFIDALSGQDARAASARRTAYRNWLKQRPAGEREQAIAVILVMHATATADAVMPTVQSIANQTRRPAELVVVTVGRPPALDALRLRADLLPFEVRWVESPSASKADAIEAGVAASHAPWIVIVEPAHTFAPGHLQALVGGIENAGAQWGFTDCTLAPLGAVAPEQLSARRVSLDATHTSLAKADSVGHAFIDQAFPAVGDGAVAFSRRLHAVLGGVRPLPGHELWDFAVRATLQDEPTHVHEATYRHAVVAGEHVQPRTEREAAQLAMFREFYALACADEPPGPNPHAPSLANWGLAFLRRMFQTGHVLMVDIATLDRLFERIQAQVSAEPAPLLIPGINLIGFAFGEFGLGENLRGLARACLTARIPFVVNDIDTRLNTRQADRAMARHLSADLRHTVSLMCMNPDMLSAARPLLERTRNAGGRTVGYWFWELETVPPAWAPAFDAVDEIWCATEFIANALRGATTKPVVKIPPALAIAVRRPYRRAEFGLPRGRFLFLFTFDYNAFVARKNPEAVIAAFRNAFPAARDDVGLIVKSVNGVHRPDRVAAINALIGEDPRIHHLDTFLGRDESYGLISVSDAYVSLHRAEGLGLGLAEAMALGKPTIATAYSGNLEFMNEGNSLLVAHRIVPVAPGEYPFHDPRFFWADPDVDGAARQMRALVDDPALRERLAAAGPQAIVDHFGPERAAALMRARLDELGIAMRVEAPM